jgi:hypothetical protein
MSPELLAPDMFGLEKSRPTKESDCYALGMTIYEVLSGQVPFAWIKSSVVIRKVVGGEHPERPQGYDGRYFTDCVWGVVQRSWEHRPRDRISAGDMLLSLEGNPIPLRSSSNMDGDVEADSDDQSDVTANDSGMFFLFHPRLIFSYPCGIPGFPIAHSGDGLPELQTGTAKKGWIGDRLARSARKTFKATTGKLFGP